MLGHKQNVFDDFHAAAEWLVAQGWTTPEQLGISGGSNGGLLVGAALTQRPELYARRRLLGAAARHGALRAVRPRRDLDRRVRHRRRPRAAGLAARLLAVPPRRRRHAPTRRCCSPSSTATPGSTRCTRASWAPRCSTRRRPTPRRAGPAAARGATSATAAGRCRAASSCRPTRSAFTAPHRPRAAVRWAERPVSRSRSRHERDVGALAARTGAADPGASVGSAAALHPLACCNRLISRVVRRTAASRACAERLERAPRDAACSASATGALQRAAPPAHRDPGLGAAQHRHDRRLQRRLRDDPRRARPRPRAAARLAPASPASRSASARRAWSRTSCPASSCCSRTSTAWAT